MKKFICLLIMLCTLLSCLPACGEPPRFESEEAMMAHLNGVWLVESKAENQEYYIFQRGELFYTDDTAFRSKVTEYLETTQTNDGREALLNTAFETATKAMMDNNLLGDSLKLDSVDPKAGIVTFDTAADGRTCKKISVGEDSVTFTDSDNLTFTLTHFVADSTFNHEHFQDIFNTVKKPYQEAIEAQIKKEQLYAEKFYGVFDFSKVLKASVPGYEGNYVYFSFTKDGACYYILSIGYDIYAGGKGTYKINDDDTLSINMKSDGKTYKDTYTFDPAKKVLKSQEKGLLGKAGTKFTLKKSSDFSFSKLKSWGKSYAKKAPSLDY